VYGPVRTVVWQGSVGDRRPYADQSSLIDGIRKQWLGYSDEAAENFEQACRLTKWMDKRNSLFQRCHGILVSRGASQSNQLGCAWGGGSRSYCFVEPITLLTQYLRLHSKKPTSQLARRPL
jgi:hypothetical protein